MSKEYQTESEVKVLDDYIATEVTLAILPVRHMDYSSIVYEQARTYYVRQTPMHIIKASCETYYSTYDGRRKAIISQTGFKYKTPMIIREQGPLLAFPTISPSEFDCAWIFSHHIKSIQPDDLNCKIIFHNEREMPLPLSDYRVNNQKNSTLHLHYLLTKHAHDQLEFTQNMPAVSQDESALTLIMKLSNMLQQQLT